MKFITFYEHLWYAVIVLTLAGLFFASVSIFVRGRPPLIKDGDENRTSFPHHRWCYDSKDLKPDDFCIQSITYREYRSYSDDPMMNFRLYGVKLGEESRAAVDKGETRILGGEKVPICKVADKYNARFCYNDETMEANLVAKNDKGQTVIVSAVDYHDISKGYSFEIIAKTK